MSKEMSEGAREFRAARDQLLQHQEDREDQETVRREFAWPRPEHFNWALDHFDHVATTRPDRTALWLVEEDGTENRHTYRQLSERSDQVANWLLSQGVHSGDRIMVALGDQVELWEITLAAIKLGAVVCPTSPALSEGDLVDRLDRGEISHVVCSPTETERFDPLRGHWTRICVGYMDGWLSYPDSEHAGLEFQQPRPTAPDDPLLMYFTSGTATAPKPVTHTQSSYPIGHLSTMYWQGVRPGDIHLNVSAPGWAKHAFGSFFGPWNAEATVLVVKQAAFDPERFLDALVRHGVDTLCAPPTVWRMLDQADPGAYRVDLREAVATGEPLDPEVIRHFQEAWGITVRDGFGQTETTMLIGNGPGQPVVTGSMGRALPGYDITIVDPATEEPSDTGEICVDLGNAPVGAMRGYSDDPERTRRNIRSGRYRTGDIASVDSHGYITYIGRIDDVFKASDYRISPFELESVLVEHEYVAEVAVVPSPDPLRLSVVKAYVTTADGVAPDSESARAILQYARDRLSPHKRVRRLEFGDLPKTHSGKIRRVHLRRAEAARGAVTDGTRNPREFWEEDLPGLKE